MAVQSALPAFAAIIVAGGSGTRAGLDQPKQFATWRGKPVLAHAMENLANAGASSLKSLIVVVPDPRASEAQAIAAHFAATLQTDLHFVRGGATRQASVRAGLEALAGNPAPSGTPARPEYVLIHDAARPVLPQAVLTRLFDALKEGAGINAGVIPVLPITDSLIVADADIMADKADRSLLRRVQTPQAFRYREILSAHRQWQGADNAGDDAQVASAAGIAIKLVEGDEALRKLTFAGDFTVEHPVGQPAMRVGTGFDVHRYGAGDGVWLGGVEIPHNRTLLGHSDADVALHAIVDALLGAIAAGDIGAHFPPGDPQWKGAPSARFAEHAASLVAEAGYTISNIDLTLICEAPKIGPYRDAMRTAIAALLAIDVSQVSVKATTTERLGFTGREEGIAAQAIAAVIKG